MSERIDPKNPTRRDFLKTSAAALAAPTIISATAFAKDDRPAPSDRVVVGSIGVGGLGYKHHLVATLLKNPRVQVGGVCDVDADHLAAAHDVVLKTAGKEVPAVKDFRDLCDRKDIDAVLIATPDHWHALCAIYACEAGKDVYCEKPLSYAIYEGQKMVAAARRYGTVFQTGSQQRSDDRFRQACRLVRSGKIGTLRHVETRVGSSDAGKWVAATKPPAVLDWNFWLGPAPRVEYRENCVHKQFRWLADYSGGKMTDWGAHHNDIAQWAIGADDSGPVKISGRGDFPTDGPYDVAAHFDVDYTYANGVQLHCHSDGENGVKFIGDNGWIFVSRKTIEASDPGLLNYQFTDHDPKLYVSHDQHENWLDCIKSRERPICDVEIGHRSATVCHLGNIAIRLGRELKWDPKAEKFVGDEEANRMMFRPMRSPWNV